ncbi:MAG: ABC transporter permease [Candidatus Anaerobiospirillum merdipullorum]|uniref:ABC transporter permease n=1 Tax=Candidatus Anaerobiospirillum merdipullorum TaxID=2838450 RepID=A0A9E2KM23_9GAMM|nr:ABC transporter permease [Candidatus Anaerobiospirillum merdipullorum]
MDMLKKFSHSSLALPLTALAILLLFNAIFVDDFFKIQVMENGNLYGRPIDILYRASSLIILSLGMTFVIATGGVDISVGAVVAISAATCCLMLGGDISGVPEHPFIIAILAALCAGIISGIWNGTLVAKFKIQAMVATLILMTAGRGIAMLLTDGQIITVYYKPFSYIGGTIPGLMLPTAMLIALCMVLLVIFLDKKTSLGLMIQSVGINQTASRYAGVKVTAVLFAVYIFSGFCAGTAGLIESSLIRAADANNAGLNMEMDAILAVTLGGTLMVGGRYYIGGTIIGAITIQTLTTTMYAVGVSSDRLPAIKAIVILLIITIQSERFKQMFREWRMKRADQVAKESSHA